MLEVRVFGAEPCRDNSKVQGVGGDAQRHAFPHPRIAFRITSDDHCRERIRNSLDRFVWSK